MTPLTRRRMLRLVLQGGIGVALLGAACTSTEGDGEPDPVGTPAGTPGDTWSWHRTDLGFVSAYVLVRAGEAVVVDTGVAGSEDAIVATLEAAGVAATDVSDVILTHRHDDHIGSVEAVASLAPGATLHAGADDVARVPLDGVRARQFY